MLRLGKKRRTDIAEETLVECRKGGRLAEAGPKGSGRGQVLDGIAIR